MEERDYTFGIKDIANPTKDEIMEFAYNRKSRPDQDWELCVIYPIINGKTILDIVNDKDCPKFKFFLGCLYLLVGDYMWATETKDINEFREVLSYAKQFDSKEIKDWLMRTEELLNNPEKYDYEYWGTHSRYVYPSSVSKENPYLCSYTGEKHILISYNNKVGLMNNQGEILVDMVYDGIHEFSEERAIIVQDDKYGFIDNKGAVIVPPKYDYASDFKDGIAFVQKGEECAFINKSGQVMGKTELFCREEFNEGFAVVEKDGKYGFVNSKGDIVIEPKFAQVSDFQNGYAAVKIDDFVYSYIDKKGNYICGFIDGEVYPFEKNTATFYIHDDEVFWLHKWGVMNEKGNYIVEPQYDFISVFVDDIAEVNKDEKWGYINREGSLITEIIFDETRAFCEGLAKIKLGDRWGYIDKSGDIVIEPKFHLALDFEEGVARVKEDNKWLVIDKTGKVIYDGFTEIFKEAHAVVCINGRYGYINNLGEVTIHPQFHKAYSFREGLAVVNTEGKWGFVNKKGEIAIELQYDDAFNFRGGLAPVKVKEKWGFINKIGEIVIEPQFDKIYVDDCWNSK